MTSLLSMLDRFEQAAVTYETSDDRADRDELHAARRAILEAFEFQVASKEYAQRCCATADANRAALVEREAELVKALEECVDTLALVEHPAIVDPVYGTEVAALGMRIGFGALMSSASASWRNYLAATGATAGAEFVAGPCHGSVVRALNIARTALHPKPKSAE